MTIQLELLNDTILSCFESASEPLSNRQIYDAVAKKMKVDSEIANKKACVGKSGAKHNLFHRRIRWAIMALKSKKLLTSAKRGYWSLINEKKSALTEITPGNNVLGASTRLGLVVWTQDKSLFAEQADSIDEFHAMITSPPYPLRECRSYGNPKVEEYCDFICSAIEPVLPKMAKGGSIVLNLTNDIFNYKSPERSTYWMELTIAIKKRLGLHFMDDIPWISNKIPGPTLWACIDRMQLKHGYEHCLWFTNDPVNCLADNRRVLKPNTEKHQRYIDSGGVKKRSLDGDGAYLKNVGDFSNPTTNGTIPFNWLQISNKCKENEAVNKYAKSLNLPVHGAKMPLALADFFVQFLTRPGDVVIDIFGGTLTTGQAAENNNRYWVVFEKMLEYIVQGFHRFRDSEDSWFNPKLFHDGKIVLH